MTTPDPAPPIPSYWESDVVLSDGGTVHLRPRRDGDHDAIVDLYSRMSDHSRYPVHSQCGLRPRFHPASTTPVSYA